MYQRLAEVPVASASGRWDAAPDLERFLASFYRYFEVKGYRGVLAVHFSHLVALAFTIVFSFILLFFVDWEALLACNSEETCRAVLLCHAKPFHHMSMRRFCVLLCFILFSIYWVFNVVAAYQNVRDAAEISTYYKDRLGIVSDEILATMTWAEVVSRLLEQQKVSPFCIVQDELTALEVANIIMREDNFMIAFTNHHTFTSRLPRWLPARLVHTRSVLWNLRAAVFNYVFDARSRIRTDFLERSTALAQRLRWLGLVNLVLVVPVLIFVTIYFFMRHAEEFRSHRSSPFQRQWTDFARWTFREFNELPHQFKARMSKAQHMAEDYVRSTKPPSPVLDSVRRCIKYVAGSILAVLLVVALWDDAPLLYVKIQEKNLLWYLAFFGFVFAVADNTEETPTPQAESRSSVSSSSTGVRQSDSSSTPLSMHCAMMQLVKCTHFLPPSWRSPAPLGSMVGSCGGGIRRAKLCQHFAKIRAEIIRDFFVFRIQVLVEELLGVILTPLLLIVYLPQAAPDIVEVVRLSRHSSANLGDWCGFGSLDPSKNGSEFYGGPPLHMSGGAGTVGPYELETGVRALEGALVSNGGKLEKSVVSFVLAHRLSWPIGDSETDSCFQHLGGNCQSGGARHQPLLLKPSLHEEMRRSLEQLSASASQGLQQFAERTLAQAQGASSTRTWPGTSQTAVPLLQAADQCDVHIPLIEFSRVPHRACEAGVSLEAASDALVAADGESFPVDDEANFTDLVPEGEDSPSGPADAASGAPNGSSPGAFQSFSLATPSQSGRGSDADDDNFVDTCETIEHNLAESDSVAETWASKVWGYPPSSLHLLCNLEEFHEREVASGSLRADVYALLPDELLRVERATSALEGSPCPVGPTCGWSDEVDHGSCSSHFFWLELLYDYHSGRHPSSHGESGGGECAAFERLDMEAPASMNRSVQAGCALQ